VSLKFVKKRITTCIPVMINGSHTCDDPDAKIEFVKLSGKHCQNEAGGSKYSTAEHGRSVSEPIGNECARNACNSQPRRALEYITLFSGFHWALHLKGVHV